ncbi:MAG: hypothetical protein LBN12_04830 [Clostridiales Family XIII bacterium]|jgi:nucleoside-triphosphatase THEP1|nr:hypothetical protein [Clostridiales Family XIII bacterium]
MPENILSVADKVSLGMGPYVNLNFIGRGNLWLENSYGDDVIRLARYLLLRALDGTAPGQLQVMGYDADLTGVFAPFSALSSGELKQLEYITGPEELKKQILYLRQHVSAVNNVIQGQAATLQTFREMIARPVESYKLIVLFADMATIDAAVLAQLSTVIKAGPAAGVSFLIVSTTTGVPVRALAGDIPILSVSGNKVTLAGAAGSDASAGAVYTPADAAEIIQNSAALSEKVKTASLPVVRFSEIAGMERLWSETSENGLTFAVGMYGTDTVSVTIGDDVNQRHNVLITGAVGQGKSNLISVIIHSLCCRYAPGELHLYLLDFKEGVTLKAFANIDQEEYLPHAKALGLESDTVFGLSVLEHLFGIYKERMKQFKEQNVKSIREYREADPAAALPRIVVIIDEFQLMFGEDDTTSRNVADILEKSVRLFRAAGIHFILASQTIGGNAALYGKTDSIFSQIPVRIAHKNSVSESQITLGTGNSAAAYLRSREAIVNLDYGEITQNKKTVVAYADEKILRPLRRRWWEAVKDTVPAPYIFESEQRAPITEMLDRIRDTGPHGGTAKAYAGILISIVGTPVAISMPDENGRNIAVFGAQDSEYGGAIGILQGIALSLAAQHASGTARFVVCDFLPQEESEAWRMPEFLALMERSGHTVSIVEKEGFSDFVKETEQALSSDAAQKKTYIFGIGMDKWRFEADPYSSDPPLKKLLDAAPDRGIHFIGWWVKTASFTAQVTGYGDASAFNTRIFLRIDERSVQALSNPFVKWNPEANRALIVDEVEYSEALTFIPYTPVSA